MGFYNEAAEFIKQFEGFTATTIWDVNAYRLGHGSDTITSPDGTFRKVVQGDVTTKEMAAKDLARRIEKDFEPKVRKQIGDPSYSDLPNPAKIALISLAYNYGSITKKAIIEAARTGDVVKLGDAIIESTKNDNAGKPYYNALLKRREKEGNFAKSVLKKVQEGIDEGGKFVKKNLLATTIVTSLILISGYLLCKTLKNK